MIIIHQKLLHECTKGTLHTGSSKISNTVPFTFNTHQIFVCDTTITIESFPWDPLDLNNQWFICKSSSCYYIKYDTCTSTCNYDIVGVFSADIVILVIAVVALEIVVIVAMTIAAV